MSYSVMLIKILPSYRVDDFLDGNLYLNTNKYFGKIDQSDEVRFDTDDGVDESLLVESLEIEDGNGGWLPIGGVLSPVIYRSDASERLNVLCLYTITDRQGDSFDAKNLEFGDSAVAILDLNAFITRVKNAAESQQKRVGRGLVEYVDRATYHGAMGPFRKFSTFDYQREFRFVFSNGTGEACRLQIGPIRDITVPMKSTDIPAFWQSMLTGEA